MIFHLLLWIVGLWLGFHVLVRLAYWALALVGGLGRVLSLPCLIFKAIKDYRRVGPQ